MRRITAVFVTLAVTFSLAACSGKEAIIMPKVEGLTLDVALSDIERAGYKKDPEVLGGGLLGILEEANWVVCSQVPEAGAAIESEPRIEVKRSCSDDVAKDEVEESAPSEDPTQEPVEETSVEPSEETSAEPSVEPYAGPEYEIVLSDGLDTGAIVETFWVYTDRLDYSTEAYKDQIKLIISDIVQKEGTANLGVSIVSDKEIILAESFTTMVDFRDEKGMDYFSSVIAPKEATDWIAWYVGGIHVDTNEVDDSDQAYEIAWFLNDQSSELWKP